MRNIKLTIEYDGSRYQGWTRLGKDESGNTISNKITEVFKENDRMCHSIINGSECGTSCLLSYENNGTYCGCNEFMLHYPEKAIAIVQKWSDENPQRTYLSEFLKNYPNAELDHGVPKV